MFGGMGKKFGVYRYAFLWIWNSRVKSVPDYAISYFSLRVWINQSSKYFWTAQIRFRICMNCSLVVSQTG